MTSLGNPQTNELAVAVGDIPDLLDDTHSGLLKGPRGLGTELARKFVAEVAPEPKSAAPEGETAPARESVPEPDAGQPSAEALNMLASGQGLAFASELASVTELAAAAEPAAVKVNELAPGKALGGSTFRIPIRRLTADLEPYQEFEWGDGSASPVYCPPAARVDDRLAEEVDNRLAAWAESIGFTPDELAKLRNTGYGRLVMLTHTDSDDPDRLLVAAQMNTAWWMADDYYADDSALGADPTRLPQRLTMAMAALDPLPDAGEFSEPLDDLLHEDKVLRAFGSAVSHLRRHATPAQVQRACYSTFTMFVSWTAYAAWRHGGETPPAWEYLAARQHDTFYTSMTLIDPVAGYEVPANLFYDERVRRAAFRAGTASVLINDLLSVKKDSADETPVCNIVLQIAADRGCSIAQATEITVALHNRMVHEFEADHHALQAIPSPELHLYLHGLRNWMGGSFEWHNTNPRYK
ncbi:family 2 encapsulin nanocompartment cargo protein terpene cyclase [Nocardia huaxiensis]|uniref:family 2 encapsulin nanocompartment cargo protein terpene cyclase n=1 Tax=Nocardia huaxiensis TaxID=2755382 RepID=UPI001E4AC9C9|nr:family 2 encapsulin nanocompartment cargo protein terpene cyclase [Nocardia huaxiensis]UFS95973.1 terpene synthase [Nocardia huaxiensis]